ncbi:MEKHLA domain-containing protein [Candidatus Enterococcus clewellii]|uniref:MEKHLA domain-containing protein n=2 Tax=Candidatus Enterococcus clewellii TaxID=1834193 RepID=A0AAQ3Y0T9_9ENTE
MDKNERYKLLELLEQSYEHWTKGRQFPVPSQEKQRYVWLDEQAPFGLLVQNTKEDPTFIYANQKAQDIFGYTLSEFLTTPSRKSAPTANQEDRKQMLRDVEKTGISDNYKGTRVDHQGNLFEISKGSIWKVLDDSGKTVGIAAMIFVDAPPVV